MPKHYRHHRDPHGHGRRRARRGSVGRSVLTLLAERPMNGYELMSELDERSGGRWKPSSGSIYPALKRLEHRGYVTATSPDDDKPRYELTDQGRERLEEYDAEGDGPPPWESGGVARHGEIRAAISELIGPARQIGRFGSPTQITAATAALKQATATMYQILADGADDEEEEDAADPNPDS